MSGWYSSLPAVFFYSISRNSYRLIQTDTAQKQSLVAYTRMISVIVISVCIALPLRLGVRDPDQIAVPHAARPLTRKDTRHVLPEQPRPAAALRRLVGFPGALGAFPIGHEKRIIVLLRTLARRAPLGRRRRRRLESAGRKRNVLHLKGQILPQTPWRPARRWRQLMGGQGELLIGCSLRHAWHILPCEGHVSSTHFSNQNSKWKCYKIFRAVEGFICYRLSLVVDGGSS